MSVKFKIVSYNQQTKMQKVIRLDTETFIQECRSGYDISKIKDRIYELELILNVRNKQIQLLTSQLNNCRQQNALKVTKLEQKIIQIQKECADLRFSGVRSKRMQNYKIEQQIKAIRLQCEAILQQQQEKHLKAYRLIQQKYSEQLQKKQEKKTQLQQFKQQQTQTYKSIKQQNYISADIVIKNLEKEKSEILLAKREAQKRVQSLTENYKNIKNQYEELISEKQDLIISMKGQIQGQQLKQNLLYKQLQQQRHKYSQLKFNKYDELQNLKILNQRLQSQNSKLKELIESKNEEIFHFLTESNKRTSRKIIIPEIEQCEHIGLINQLQRSLDLKSLQLQQVKSKMEEWTNKIGFDQPVVSRIDAIFKKAQRVDKMKTSQNKALRQKNNHYANKQLK